MKTIEKKNWISNFTLIGTPKINDYTFKIDEQSEKSSWIYNSLNLGIDCGERCGVVYCELMGGYSDERENVIYVHGKKEDGSDDWSAQLQVDWEDRFDEEILETIGDACFITVGLEKTTKKKTYTKKFLSAYDAIAYIQQYLSEDMVVNVRGSLKFSEYNGQTQVRKQLNSIVLSKRETPDFTARFTQTILINSESVNIKNIDKEKGIVYINAKVLDYLKEKNGIEYKSQYPYDKQFEFRYPELDEKLVKGINNLLFKVKRGWTQITLNGELIEGGAVVTATWDDVPEAMKQLVTLKVWTKEQAIAKCSENSGREQRMVFFEPYTKKGEDDIPEIQSFPERYKDDDLIIDFDEAEDDEDEDVDDINAESSDASDMSWLDALK